METFDEIISKLSNLVGKNITLEMFREERGCRGNLDEGEYWTTFLIERYLLEMTLEGCYVVKIQNNLRNISSESYIRFFTGFDAVNNSRRVVVPALLEENTIGWSVGEKFDGKRPLDDRFYKNFPSRRKIIERKEWEDLRLFYVLHYLDCVMSIKAEDPKMEIQLYKKGHLSSSCYRPYLYFTNQCDFGFNNEGILYYNGITDSYPLKKIL